MKCPFCYHQELKVIDSREAVDLNAIRRHRECQGCQKRFTSFETVDLAVQVEKRDGTFENFDQQKLIDGMGAASHHTTISKDLVMAIALRDHERANAAANPRSDDDGIG